MDIFGALPQTEKGNRYILSIEDRLTKCTVLIALQNKTTSYTIEALIEHYIYVYGALKTILSD